jgi:hypothetical protein
MGQKLFKRWWQALNANASYYFPAFLRKAVKRMEHYMTSSSGDNKEVIKTLKISHI